MAPTPIRWSDDVETQLENEEAIIRETVDTMRATMEKGFDTHRHAASGTHAKSHGALVGKLTIREDLPGELAQGMFADPAAYDVVLRVASEPGQIDPDTAARARGVALKVLNVPGEKLVDGFPNQDWLFNTWPVIPDGDAEAYLVAIQQRERHAGHHLLTTATTILRNKSFEAALFDRTPNIHPLAHTYYTQSAFRYGDYIAKLRLRPATVAQRELESREVKQSDPTDVLSRWMREYAADNETRFTLEVQLCTDLDQMPVEDASVEWSEEASPYIPVADVVFAPQESFSPASRVYVDDKLGGRPWSGLVEHRPLGSINRVRRSAYEELGKWRRQMNAVEPQEPTSIEEIPE